MYTLFFSTYSTPCRLFLWNLYSFIQKILAESLLCAVLRSGCWGHRDERNSLSPLDSIKKKSKFKEEKLKWVPGRKVKQDEGLESPGGGKGRAFTGCSFVQTFEGPEGDLWQFVSSSPLSISPPGFFLPEVGPYPYHTHGASQVALVVKNPPASSGDGRDVSLIPGLGRSPGVGNGNSLH